MLEVIKVIAACVSAGAACVAAVLASIIAFKQRAIHKKSYKPYCDICCIDYNKEIAIKIKNSGIGVMTIKSFEVHDRNSNIIHKNLYSCISDKITLTRYSVDILERSIAPNSRLILLEKKLPDDIDVNSELYIQETESFKKLRKELKTFTIKVNYVDMYGKQRIAEKDLSQIYGEKRRLP